MRKREKDRERYEACIFSKRPVKEGRAREEGRRRKGGEREEKGRE